MPVWQQPRATDTPRPEVIVDFECRRGLLFIVLANIGKRSAYAVTTSFGRPLHGLEGSKCVSDLQLFKRVEFMPPGKRFSQLVDPVSEFFRRRQPAKIAVSIAYRDREGHRFQEKITHDLRIYRDLGWIEMPPSGGNDAGEK